MKYFIVFIVTVLNLYALVSIAPVEIGKKPGFSGTLSGEFDTKRGNSDSESYAAGVKLSYDNNQSYVLWSQFDFSYGEASGVKNTNKTFSHIRYIHTLKDDLNWEIFVQSQTNEFTKVAERLLNGGGLRIHLTQKNYGNFYFGLGAFYEYIDYTTSIDASENNLRANLYIAYTKVFNKNSKFSYVAYYQPKVTNVNDYVILNALELTIPLYKALFLSFSVYYDKDSTPAMRVKKEDFSQKTAFKYQF